MEICVIQDGRLATAEVSVSPTGDTTFNGQPISTAFANSSDHAIWATWFMANEPITYQHHSYIKYGLPRVLNIGDVDRAGAYRGVDVFVERGIASTEVLYLPLTPFCEFQPYQRESRAVAVTDERRPPKRALLLPGAANPTYRSVQSQTQVSDGSGATQFHIGTIESQLPKRFREGKTSLVTFMLMNAPPARRGVEISIDTVQAVSLGRIVSVPESTLVVTDTTTQSPAMRLSLSTDSVDGPAFAIVPQQSSDLQPIRPSMPARWSFRVTPLKGGPQNLYVTLELDDSLGRTPLRTIPKLIQVEVDTMWEMKHWILANVPLMLTAVIIPFITWLGTRVFKKGRPRWQSRFFKNK
jgi:hypothetical protein